MNALPPETTLLSLSGGVPRPSDQREDHRQFGLLRIGCLLFDDRRELCLIRNVSAGGALVRTYSQVRSGQAVAIELKQGESVSGLVRWSDGNMIGIMFNQPVDVVQLLADSADWPRPRQPRVEVQCLAELVQDEHKSIAQLLDISQGGVKLRCSSPLQRNKRIDVEVRGLPSIAAYLRWNCDDIYGLTFKEQLPLANLVRWVRSLQAEPARGKAA